jgi:hypothetical protein
MKRRPLFALAVLLAVMAAVAGITLGVTTLLGVTFQREGTQPCVQAVEIDADGQPLRGDAAVEETAKSAIEEAMAVVEKQPRWDDAGYVAPPVVDIGCPSPPLGVLGGPAWVNGHDRDGTPVPHVDQASRYRLFVFVMPSLADIQRVLGHTSGSRAGAQEFIEANIYDEGPTLIQVTYGVYLTAEEIQAGGPFLTHALTEGLGLP